MQHRIAILASGSGTNAENICKYFLHSSDIEIVLIGSNNKNAFVLERAKKFGIPTITFTKSDLLAFSNFYKILQNYKVDFIVLAGFLLQIPEAMIEMYSNKIINIHPSLLPKYGGKGMYGENVHKAVIENKEQYSGITIHYVNKNYDEGEIIFQTKCTLETNETPESLSAKIHALEHQYFPQIIAETILKK